LAKKPLLKKKPAATLKRKPLRRKPPTPAPKYTPAEIAVLEEMPVNPLAEYCAIERISESTFYEERKRGVGVEFFMRGAKIYVGKKARLRHRARLERQAKLAAKAREAAAKAKAAAEASTR
jgi:hypothetical protein